MKLPGTSRRRRWRVALGTLALPPLLWALALAVVPTERFRACVAEKLSASSGRAVDLGGLRIGFLGGVRLSDLRIGAPTDPDDPWLVVRRARIDVSLLQLVFGRIEPSRVEIEGLDLRLLRRDDGTLELSDILAAPADAGGGGGGPGRDDREAPGLTVVVSKARIRVVDEPTATLLEFLDVEGRATCRGDSTAVEEFKGTVNGGPFEFVGQFTRGDDGPEFGGRLVAEDVALRDGMSALAYLVPVLCGSQAKIEGRLSLDVAVSGEGRSREAIRRSLKGKGRVALDPILLDGSRLLSEFGRFVELPPTGRVGAVRSTFTIGDGKVVNDPLTIDVGRVPVSLSGSTDFDGTLNYRLRGDAIAERIPARARQYLTEMEIDLEELAEVRVQGTVDAMVVKVNGQSLDGGEVAPAEERRDRLREIGRRLRDRLRR